MKEEYNVLSIFKVMKYKREKKKDGTFPYSGLEVYMGAQGKRKNIISNKRNKKKIRNIPKSNINK